MAPRARHRFRAPRATRARVPAAQTRLARACLLEIPNNRDMAFRAGVVRAGPCHPVAAQPRPPPKRSALRSTALAGGERSLPGVRPRELPCHAAAARAALE